jgi:hypothetical protein
MKPYTCSCGHVDYAYAEDHAHLKKKVCWTCSKLGNIEANAESPKEDPSAIEWTNEKTEEPIKKRVISYYKMGAIHTDSSPAEIIINKIKIEEKIIENL